MATFNVAYISMKLGLKNRQQRASLKLALMEHLNWELFDLSPYSPVLYPKDYHLFTYLIYRLLSQRYNNTYDLLEGVKIWLNAQAADLFD
jgi:hypothetical protein